MGRDPAIAIVRVAGLGDEPGDHPVELQAVIDPLPGQTQDALDGEGREVGTKPHRHPAPAGVDHQEVGVRDRPPFRSRREGGERGGEAGRQDGGGQGEAGKDAGHGQVLPRRAGLLQTGFACS